MSEKIEITPDYVKSLQSFTPKFLCSIEDNTYKIKFTKLVVKDFDSKEILIEHINNSKKTINDLNEEELKKIKEIEEKDIYKSPRMIKYHLSSNILKKKISLNFEFMGEKPIKDFIIIERHYIKDKYIGGFESKFPFCFPQAPSNKEEIIDLNKNNGLNNNIKKEMTNNVILHKSDTFCFVENKLIIHNKAIYYYTP